MTTTLKYQLVQLISALFMLLFTYTAISKLAQQQAFRIVLGGAPLIAGLNHFFAWFIPALEIMIVLLLFFPSLRSAGLLASAVLMSLFTLYIGYMLVFVPSRPCSCGGILQQMTWLQHLVFNICFTLLAFVAYYLNPSKDIIAINRTRRTPV